MPHLTSSQAMVILSAHAQHLQEQVPGASQYLVFRKRKRVWQRRMRTGQWVEGRAGKCGALKDRCTIKCFSLFQIVSYASYSEFQKVENLDLARARSLVTLINVALEEWGRESLMNGHRAMVGKETLLKWKTEKRSSSTRDGVLKCVFACTMGSRGEETDSLREGWL